jgi:hypothetical protein
VAFTSANPTSTNIAVQMGLGISIKTARSLPDGCRLLGTEDGLPPLGSVLVEIHLMAPVPSEPVRMVRKVLLEAAARYDGFTPSP